MERTLSMQSFTSDQLDEVEQSVDFEVEEFDKCPWDIMGEHDSVGGVIIVASKGEKLPLETKYKMKAGASVPVKFLVYRTLEVTPVERVKKVKLNADVLDHSRENSLLEQSSLDLDESLPQGTGKSLPQGTVIVVQASGSTGSGNQIVREASNQKASDKRFLSEAEFLVDLDNRFEEIVIDGLEVSLRNPVREKMNKNEKLLGKENNGVINSVNMAVCEQYGKSRPSNKLCTNLAEILKAKFPATFRIQSAVNSSFGPLSLPRSRGDGGHGDLVKRIGNCFYNQIIRPTIKRPVSNDEIQVSSGGKKKRKSYVVNASKLNIFESASKVEFEEAKRSYLKFEEANTIKEKQQLLPEARIYIQKMFQTVEPTQLVEDLTAFWEGGPVILSDWFEWLTDGSKLGSLALSTDEQLTKVINIVEEFIINKKGKEFENEMKRVKDRAEEKHGHHDQDLQLSCQLGLQCPVQIHQQVCIIVEEKIF